MRQDVPCGPDAPLARAGCPGGTSVSRLGLARKHLGAKRADGWSAGRAGVTGCDAAHYWHQPARFRRLCPLLIETPDGLRCSVDTKDVRPFWRRAAAYYLGAAGGIYLAGLILAFVFLRIIGYPLSPLTLAWPPRLVAKSTTCCEVSV